MATSRFRSIRAVCSTIDLINYWIGTLCSYVIFAMVLMMTYEVVCRYVFNAPTVWSGELNQYGLCIISMMGGAYAILMDEHVRVDIFFQRFSLKRRAVFELATWWLVLVFCVVLIWKGSGVAVDAYLNDEKSMGFMDFPTYPTLALVPIGAFLMLLQALVRIVRNILSLVTNEDENSLAASRFHGMEKK